MKKANIPKVLLVEDVFVLHLELKEFLEEKGYHVLEDPTGGMVNTYDKAVNLAFANPPDIAVLDVNLGDKHEKDGIDLALWLRQHFGIPIIILSGYGNEVNLKRLIDSKLYSFVSRDGSASQYLRQLGQTITLELARASNQDNSGTKTMARIPLKEIKIEKKPAKQEIELAPHDPVFIERFINWDDISFASSATLVNNSWKNYIWLHQQSGNKEFIYRGTLQDLEKLLPHFFCRFNRKQIVNLKLITGFRKNSFYLDDEEFELSPDFEEQAKPKILKYCNID